MIIRQNSLGELTGDNLAVETALHLRVRLVRRQRLPARPTLRAQRARTRTGRSSPWAGVHELRGWDIICLIDGHTEVVTANLSMKQLIVGGGSSGRLPQ